MCVCMCMYMYVCQKDAYLRNECIALKSLRVCAPAPVSRYKRYSLRCNGDKRTNNTYSCLGGKPDEGRDPATIVLVEAEEEEEEEEDEDDDADEEDPEDELVRPLVPGAVKAAPGTMA